MVSCFGVLLVDKLYLVQSLSMAIASQLAIKKLRTSCLERMFVQQFDRVTDSHDIRDLLPAQSASGAGLRWPKYPLQFMNLRELFLQYSLRHVWFEQVINSRSSAAPLHAFERNQLQIRNRPQ